MNSAFSRMVLVGLTLWLGLAAGTANAITLTISDWNGSAGTGYNAAFGNPDVGSVFNDWISFTIPSDSSGNVESSVNSLGDTGLIFTAFDLYEGVFLIASGITGGSSSDLSYTGRAVPGEYSLNVAGYKIGHALSFANSYSGQITISPVAPVPEPETYAMMLAGLGMLGFSARRRMNNA